MVSILGGSGREIGALMAALAGGYHVVAVGPLNRWAECAGRIDSNAGFMRDAPFWREVLAAYRRLHHGVPFAVLAEVHELLESEAGLLRLLCGRAPRWAIEIYHNHAYKLARAVASVSGRSLIVERSNCPGRAHLLLRNPCLESRIIAVDAGPRARLLGGLVRRGAPGGCALSVRVGDLLCRFGETLATVRRFIDAPSGAGPSCAAD